MSVWLPSGACGQECELSFVPIFTKFGTQLPLNVPKKIVFLGSPLNICGQGHITTIVILPPLNISAALNSRAFKVVQQSLYAGFLQPLTIDHSDFAQRLRGMSG